MDLRDGFHGVLPIEQATQEAPQQVMGACSDENALCLWGVKPLGLVAELSTYGLTAVYMRLAR